MAQNENDQKTTGPGQSGQKGTTGNANQPTGQTGDQNRNPQEQRSAGGTQAQTGRSGNSRNPEDLGGFPSGTGTTGSGNQEFDNPRNDQDTANQTTGANPGMGTQNQSGQQNPQGQANQSGQQNPQGQANQPGAENDPNRQRQNDPTREQFEELEDEDNENDTPSV